METDVSSRRVKVSSTRAARPSTATIDGFISDPTNHTPVQEPFLPNPMMNVGGNAAPTLTCATSRIYLR